jgi:hypothetical protein
MREAIPAGAFFGSVPMFRVEDVSAKTAYY